MKKIVTMCSQGLCRSVGMADVLKLHFEPVDVIPMGYRGNTEETQHMLFDWADLIIIMETHMMKNVPESHHDKTFVCDVGPDTYGGKNIGRRVLLIGQCWRWLRENTEKLGIMEHSKKL